MTEPTTSGIAHQIEILDEATAVEAARLLAAELGARPATGVTGQDVIDRPLEHRKDIADLSRLLLLVAATDPETRPLVVDSLAGAGRKQLVLGGAELLVLAPLALGALQVCLSRGRTREEEIIRFEKKADGSEVTTIRKTVAYGISAKLGAVVRSVIPGVTGSTEPIDRA
jgi:hypothetical protein